MKKLFVFRKLLDFMADHTEVIDADMENCLGYIEIIGEADGQIITIKASMRDKEENNA